MSSIRASIRRLEEKVKVDSKDIESSVSLAGLYFEIEKYNKARDLVDLVLKIDENCVGALKIKIKLLEKLSNIRASVPVQPVVSPQQQQQPRSQTQQQPPQPQQEPYRINSSTSNQPQKSANYQSEIPVCDVPIDDDLFIGSLYDKILNCVPNHLQNLAMQAITCIDKHMYHKAIELLSYLIKQKDKPILHFYRSQCYLGVNDYRKSQDDLQKSKVFDTTQEKDDSPPNTLNPIINAFLKNDQYRQALKLLKDQPKTNDAYWHYCCAICYTTLGFALDGIEHLLSAVKIDPRPMYFCNLAISYFHYGDCDNALLYHKKCLDLKPNHLNSIDSFCETCYLSGKLNTGLKMAMKRHEFKEDPKELVVLGNFHFSKGNIFEAYKFYTRCLQLKEGDLCWYTREIVAYTATVLLEKFEKYNPDSCNEMIKENLCKRIPLNVSAYAVLIDPTNYLLDVGNDDITNGQLIKIIEVMGPIGKTVQLKCPGFLSNQRMHRMSSLCIYQTANVLKKYISDSTHFDIETYLQRVIKWRQLADPRDAVFWVNKLTPASFNEGFGVSTPLYVTGNRAIRYYSYFDQGINLFRQCFSDQFVLTDTDRIKVEKAKTLKDFHDIMKRDFYIIVPCPSLAKENTIYEGTRIVIRKLKQDDEGYEFSIRCPCTPKRYKQIIEELKYVMQKYFEASRLHDRDSIIRYSIYFFYYMCNFSPITRGTALSAYLFMFSMLLANGLQFDELLPKDIQRDWEALFATSPQIFYDGIFKSSNVHVVDSNILDNLPAIDLEDLSLREIFQLLNFNNLD